MSMHMPMRMLTQVSMHIPIHVPMHMPLHTTMRMPIRLSIHMSARRAPLPRLQRAQPLKDEEADSAEERCGLPISSIGPPRLA